MRFVRFRRRTEDARDGVVSGTEIVPLERQLAELIADGRAGLELAGRRALDSGRSPVRLDDVELLPPIQPVTIVGPGPRLDGAALRDLSRHREFYLKSAHTLQPGSRPIPYRAAVGTLSYRAQLGVLMEPGTGRHLSLDDARERVLGVILIAELMSVDLLRVGWEGTMWHTRFGEGASFDGSTPCGPWLAVSDGVAIDRTTLSDSWGDVAVEASEVAEQIAYVSQWLALGPEVLVLAGSRHGPVLTLEAEEPVIAFGPDEPRLRVGGRVRAAGEGLGEIDAAIGDSTTTGSA